MPAAFQLFARPGHPTFLDLPWDKPLEEWQHERMVQVVRGISRHVVRFVDYDGCLYALKELPRRYAEREYRLLTALVKHAGRVLSQRHLLKEVWGPTHTDQAHYLRVYMGALRRKLERDPARPRYLLTEPGVGYRLAAE